MGESRWKKVEEIIDKVLDLPKDQRIPYLEKTCTDKDLKAEVLEMLQSITDSEGWLEGLRGYRQKVFDENFDSVNSLSSDTLIGTQFGSYTIIEKIGEGGMGVIFLAERTDASFNHQVAIKIIRNGRATQENIQRFKREQQILARLNHPGIAQLYDGGVTDEGFPYIIMEYVDGLPITEYCDKQQCTVSEKVRLIEQVLKAVQNAHENLTVHRDLKPDNILIDGSGNVKILDFGISKLLEDIDNLMLTQTGSKILTPRYAAPEQIKGQRITTATDMYSLGVVFYKLLTGTDPYPLDNKTRYEVEQTIIQDEPCKPSEVINNPQLKKLLKGDLDAILLKSMRKEYDRRYRVASEFLEDLKHYETGLPVSAHEGSFKYKSQKFIKRNKQPLAYTVVTLIILISTALYYTDQLRHERNIAKTEAQTANEVTDFLIELFEANAPVNSRGNEITAIQLLNTGEKKIGNLSSQPLVQNRLMEVLGSIYSLLNKLEKADSLKYQSVELSKDLYSVSDPELAKAYFSLAQTKHVLGDYDKTLALVDTALEYQSKIFEKPHIDLGNSLRLKAETLKDMGNIDSAFQVIQSAREIFTGLRKTKTRDYLSILKEYATILSEKGEFRKSVDIWNEHLDISTNLFDPPHPDILSGLMGISSSYKELSEFAEAESLYVKAVDMAVSLHGENHLNTATVINNLAGLYYYTQEYSKADTLFERSYKVLENILGSDHPSVASALYNRANLKIDMKEYHEAEEIYKRVLAMDIEYFGRYHPNVASDHTGIGSLLKNQKKYSEAEKHFSESLEIRRNVYQNENHPYIAQNLRSLADIMVKTNRFEAADSLYRQSLIAFITSYGKDNADVKNTIDKYLNDAKLWGYQNSEDSLIDELSQNFID
ncbi:tetratricopeptide repeat protein [Gracilimonas sp. Q87]|uniref:tetratricopeptide repeat protein n=1 Tax=Gracilimonas sp. Q87 TaxID=3384766 RepID=UPI0039842DED